MMFRTGLQIVYGELYSAHGELRHVQVDIWRLGATTGACSRGTRRLERARWRRSWRSCRYWSTGRFFFRVRPEGERNEKELGKERAPEDCRYHVLGSVRIVAWQSNMCTRVAEQWRAGV